MINVLANKSLEFSNGSETVKTVVGFCALPDWVGEDPFYQLAISDGSLMPFEGTSDKAMEEVLKLKEENKQAREEIKKASEAIDQANKNASDYKNEADSLRAELEALKSAQGAPGPDPKTKK